MFQLTKVGLPVNVVNGVNPLSNGMINPTGNKARAEISCQILGIQYSVVSYRMQGGGESMEFSVHSCPGWGRRRRRRVMLAGGESKKFENLLFQLWLC